MKTKLVVSASVALVLAQTSAFALGPIPNGIYAGKLNCTVGEEKTSSALTFELTDDRIITQDPNTDEGLVVSFAQNGTLSIKDRSGKDWGDGTYNGNSITFETAVEEGSSVKNSTKMTSTEKGLEIATEYAFKVGDYQAQLNCKGLFQKK